MSSTGCTSAVERLMTLSTSLVAVWYSSDSSRSRVRACNSPSSRAFSIAMTAWSAKVRTSSICRSVNGSTRFRERVIAPSTAPSRSSGTPSTVRRPEAAASGSAIVRDQREYPRHARPGLRALPARRCLCRDQGQWFAGAGPPITRHPLRMPGCSPHSGRLRPCVS